MCQASVTSSVELLRLDIVVCNGTNNYVNYFYTDLKIDFDLSEIRMNLFVFPMQLHATNQKKGRFKWKNG